jgi:hypothetical protein
MVPTSIKNFMDSYNFKIFADYFQFYLQDETLNCDLGESWTEDALNNLIAVTPEVVGIGTVRNMTVPVVINIIATSPEEDLAQYDKVNECSIELPSGRLVISGGSEYFLDAPRITVTPGIYRVRVYYKNLNKISPDGLDGEDEYKVVLWPQAPYAPVLKLR